MNLSVLIRQLLDGGSISPTALEDALHSIMQGEAEPVLIAGLLVALATRPLDSALVAAAARALRAHRVAIHANVRPLIDTCGTGGDGSGTFNISTAAAMVVAASGAAVSKHGNRGVSSPVGSADVLEAAGCALQLGPEDARSALDATGFAFLFAPVFHPAMAHVAPVRRALGVRTIFNVLGPLANPALAEFQLLGVYDPSLTKIMAEALAELGTQGAWVVHCDGLDEVGLHGVTRGHRVDADGRVEEFSIDPGELDVSAASLAELAGAKDSAGNVNLLRSSLAGDDGARSDVVALNAAAALVVAGRADDLSGGLEQARSCMRNGAAARVLDRYVESSQRAAGERT